jgi:putative SOS response-associated peptidase YedK
MPQSMATTKNPTRESPNDLLADVLDRMPVILSAEHYDRWLDPGIHALESVLALLMPYDSAMMRRYPVSARGNVVTNDGPECSAPVDLPAQTGSLFG